MNKTIFIDTSGFYALLVKADDRHVRAADILHKASAGKQRFVTTDYILGETATLLRARKHGHIVAQVFDTVFNSEACSVAWVDQERFAKAQAFFLKHADQAWSFTDCASFVLMKEKKLTLALTNDAHFHHAGFVALLV